MRWKGGIKPTIVLHSCSIFSRRFWHASDESIAASVTAGPVRPVSRVDEEWYTNCSRASLQNQCTLDRTRRSDVPTPPHFGSPVQEHRVPNCLSRWELRVSESFFPFSNNPDGLTTLSLKSTPPRIGRWPRSSRRRRPRRSPVRRRVQAGRATARPLEPPARRRPRRRLRSCSLGRSPTRVPDRRRIR